MCIKLWLHYPLLRSLDNYKVRLCFIVLSVTVCTVGYICLFHGDEILVDYVSFLSMIIYEVLYTWCVRYNICNTWFLDIRISTCFRQNSLLSQPLSSMYMCTYTHAYCVFVKFYCGHLTTNVFVCFHSWYGLLCSLPLYFWEQVLVL